MDVQQCILFAKQFQLRVTILSSGHDLIGRAIADNTVHINLMRMNSLTVNASDTMSDTGVSATVQPGLYWRKIYELVNDF